MRPFIAPSSRRRLLMLPGGSGHHGISTKWRPTLQGGLSFRSVAKIGFSVILLFAVVNLLVIYAVTTTSSSSSNKKQAISSSVVMRYDGRGGDARGTHEHRL
jgi:hypothetical protein